MRKVGLWDSEEKIRNKVQNLKTKKKIGCLKKNPEYILKFFFKLKKITKSYSSFPRKAKCMMLKSYCQTLRTSKN